MKILKQVLLTTVLIAPILNVYGADNIEVNHISELKQIVKSELNGKVAFKNLAKR